MGVVAVPWAVRWGVLAAVSRPSQLKPGAELGLWCLVAVGVGFVLTLPAAFAWLRGEPLRGALRPTVIASAATGPVVLTGAVEPAWTMLRSPLTGRGCVYYHASASVTEYFLLSKPRIRLIFAESNAVPFILNDGTGRLLVLARYAGWTAADGTLDAIAGGQPVARADSGWDESTADWTDLAPAPPCLEAYRDEKYDMYFVAAHGRESMIAIGQQVTVTGSLVPYRSVIERNARASLDGGASLGLAGDLVVAPTRYSFTGLVVMAGSAKDIRSRGSLRVALAVVGLVVMALGLAALLIAVPIVAASSQ